MTLHRCPPLSQLRCKDSGETSPTQNLLGAQEGWAPLPQGAPTRSEAGRRTREAERGTIQSSLAPPQRPPPNLSPPTFRAVRQPPPQDSLPGCSPGTELRSYPGPSLGTASTCFMYDPSNCLGWILFLVTLAVLVPRAQGEKEVDQRVWSLGRPPDKGQKLRSPEYALSGKSQTHPKFYLGQAGSWPLGVGGKTRGQVRPSSLHPSPPYPQLGARL